ncbi:hypothetical protein Tsubulata_043155 [Turnera subulata]|uniref:RNA-dependent RNA polymerase n=1 Tax=Turnera subulata TaxID=218843 RepID=A0A9Q0FWV0_9ROSI|nr:hypothetical protein Tsubulata_043155 [Turnera subulata]
MDVGTERATAAVTNIPYTALAKDLVRFFESKLGQDSVFALEISSQFKNWKSRGFGRVQFASLDIKRAALTLSLENKLFFGPMNLGIAEAYDDIVPRPAEARFRSEDGVLHVGFMREERCMSVLERFGRVRGWVMPGRSRVEFWIWAGEERYKLEVRFEDILAAVGCRLDGGGGGGGGRPLNAILLKLKYGPRIYQTISGPDVVSKFSGERYNFCKEDFNFAWVRTTDFSAVKSIGLSTSFCWVTEEGLVPSDILKLFPNQEESNAELILKDGKEFCSGSEIVPLAKFVPDSDLAYEVLFQLNSLVHTQKITLASVDAGLIKLLSSVNKDTAVMILQKMHKLNFTCYDPLSFIKSNLEKPFTSAPERLMNRNIMRCHRCLITPSKIYCLGPELESSNYVMKRFAEYASDFMRVTFVDEDWSKLPVHSISSSIGQGIFAKPLRTKIYHRILSVLRDGIVIGAKRFEFLAFSASQLRSNSVWMFSSNDNVKAESIREWMGCFSKIRSVSKCAARMGQLFSSSIQTFDVPEQDVEIIPDIEMDCDGISYCFSDGIGKISLQFARKLAEKCGLNETPSVFQIRYGGYKGVVAVDRNSFRKLSLRTSMLKFESENRMLNVTSWSDSMPCYLNREIVSLLSTLGVKDEALLSLQQVQLDLLGKMLTDREAALAVLQSFAWAGSKDILTSMLLEGYEPGDEPYLSMMLQAYHENLLTELKTRCRVFVPKGRVVIGCLDETGVLDYGKVYIRTTMTKAELKCENMSFFKKVDETTSVIVGKVIVTKNPCLHPGDIRVLEAVFEEQLMAKGLVDCIVFPQKGKRPHPNECSGGDLDGDLYFISWDQDLIPSKTENPMDYIAGRPRIMDHNVTLEEIHKFFVDYMINDTLGAISTAHLVLADREPDKACSEKCLKLAALHSMAVDFAKSGAPAEMPRYLKPKEFPDFMERADKPMYVSDGVLGKLYRATLESAAKISNTYILSERIAPENYDSDLQVEGFEEFLQIALSDKEKYVDKMSTLMNYYGAVSEDEILTGNLRNREAYLQRDNRRYFDTKDRILLSVKNLKFEAKEWFECNCRPEDRLRKASAWYHVTYHPTFCNGNISFLSFPWTIGDILLNIKSMKRGQAGAGTR